MSPADDAAWFSQTRIVQLRQGAFHRNAPMISPVRYPKVHSAAFRFALGAIFSASLQLSADAQNRPAQPRNLIPGGTFERAFTRDNLYDGVATGDFLSVNRHSVQALTERSAIGPVGMPPSVQAADLNGDQTIDLLVGDPTGYIYFYPNSGTPAEPMFTSAEILPLYLSMPDSLEQTRNPQSFAQRDAPRLALADWRRTGALDLFVGVFSGELFYLQNFGNSRTIDFRQPQPLSKGVVQIADQSRLWANLIAPAIIDLNGDNRLDVLLGEGTYSANNIHLLLNNQPGAAPKFTTADRYYLAYGDGKEHLIPALADYNGDGYPDVIAGDREGSLSLYLHPGPAWEPGEEFKFSSVINIGAQQRQSGLISLAAADFNGDGLFDLVIGRNTGRMALALNTGTRSEPKFAALTELKGKDVWGRSMKVPSGWMIDLSDRVGNVFCVATTVTAEEDPAMGQPPEGKSALKVHYVRPETRYIKFPDSGIPGALSTVKLGVSGSVEPSKTYSFQIRSRGASVRTATYSLQIKASKVLARRERKLERGVEIMEDRAEETITEDGTLSTGGSWSTVSKSVNVRLRNKDLQDLKRVPFTLEIEADLTPLRGEFYLDDIQLVEKL